MDDILDSEDTMEDCVMVARDITAILNLGDLEVKAGKPPSQDVSVDGDSVGLLGYLWEPEMDLLRLDIKDLYLEKARRGKPPEPIKGDIKTALRGKFTKRVLTGKVAGVYDPLGLAAPITAKYKLDLHELSLLKLDWDDPVPEELLDTWVTNLSQIQDLRSVHFRRTIIPADAINTNITLVVSVDASENLAMAVVPSCVETKGNKFLCQLIAAKAMIVSVTTILKAELKPALLGSVLGHTVKSNLGSQYAGSILVTDSTISLYWMNQDERPLQVGVRNCVIQIRRFSDMADWSHVSGELNIADLGTRPTEVFNIDVGSEWQVGKKWMTLPRHKMPLVSPCELTLSNEEKRIAAKETKARDIGGHVLTALVDKVSLRYAFSRYVVDPCVLSWHKSVRVLAYVKRFIAVLKNRIKKKSNTSASKDGTLTPREIEEAEQYFFLKGTEEVRQFAKSKEWKECSILKDGVLCYKGRILDGQEVLAPENVMIDLEPLSFVRPILDRYSPVAYAIMIYCHQSVVHHRNAVVTLRESRCIAYILHGRDLAN